jgi:H+/Cl- antiporter ClcA
VKISAQVSVVLAVIFAIACFAVAVNGFTSLGGITDPGQLSDARGFAWFWALLGMIAVVFGAVGVWMVRTTKDDE